MIEWPIYRNFSVFSQNSGYFDQNEKGVKKCPFPHSLRFCHNWWASGGVPGVRYAEKLSALFYLHWESLWPGVYRETQPSPPDCLPLPKEERSVEAGLGWAAATAILIFAFSNTVSCLLYNMFSSMILSR